MDKRGIELSVNFLVGFVLAIVLFGLGISLLYTIFHQSEDIYELTQNEIDNRVIELLCNAKQRVCVSGNRVAQERGELAIYGIYIYNIYDQVEDFDVFVEAGIAYDENKEDIENDLDLITRHEEKRINPNEQDYIGIGVFVPKDAVSGTYIFNVNVAPLNVKRKIYVSVE